MEKYINLTEEEIDLIAKAFTSYKADLKGYLKSESQDEVIFAFVELDGTEKLATKLGLTKNNFRFESKDNLAHIKKQLELYRKMD
jgi:hypothetical protein